MKKEEILKMDIQRLACENAMLKQENEQLKANNDYIAMMTDVELPESEVD